jgi:hypothetical protein
MGFQKRLGVSASCSMLSGCFVVEGVSCSGTQFECGEYCVEYC